MVDEMNLRGLSENTQTTYLRSMNMLIKHFKGKSPEKLHLDDIKQFVINVRKYNGKKLSANSINRHLSAIKFFYRVVLNRKDYDEALPRHKTQKKIPIFFTQQEIRKMIDVLYNIKFKAIFMTLYSTGMRLSELRNLKPTDIDSKRMVINIRNGKGGKDRQVILSPNLLSVLRTYWRLNKDDKSTYLFAPSKNSVDPKNLNKPLTHTSIQYVLDVAAKAAGIKKKSILML